MSYFMRYILTEDVIDLAALEQALHEIDPLFSIHIDQSEPNSGDLYYGEAVYGEIAINQPGETVFDEDMAELREILEPIEDVLKPGVLRVLDAADAMIALLVLEAGHSNPEKLDVLWDYCFDHYPGVLQVDDEGYYNRDQLILPTTLDES
jgi:hypothetical protein